MSAKIVYNILLLLLLTVRQSLSFRNDIVVQVTHGSSLSVSMLRLKSITNHTSSTTTTDLESSSSSSSSTHLSDDEQSETEEAEASNDSPEEKKPTSEQLKERFATGAGWTTNSKWNRSQSSSYYSFKTQLLNERPLGGFNVVWGRSGSRKAALFSMPNQNFNVIPNNDSTTANAEAGVAMLESTTTTTPRTTMAAQAKAIFQMCRPKNLPACVLIHVVALRIIQAAVASDSSLSALFFSPGVLATLSALLLITSVSMLLNDYYDSKSGVDMENEGIGEDKPLVTGVLPRAVVRQVITLMCIAIITSTFNVPSNAAKFGIVASGVAVYYYTEYIKPITWVKNICCATLIAASPIVSALAAFQQLVRDNKAAATLDATALVPLGRMVLSMFSWSMSREIVMDIRDCKLYHFYIMLSFKNWWMFLSVIVSE